MFTIVSFAASFEIPIIIQVENATTSTLYIQEAHLNQGQLTKTHRIDLKNGYAQFVYPVEDGSFIELIYNGYKIPMYLHKRSTPTVSFNAHSITETLHYSGIGSADNNFIAKYFKGLGGTSEVVKECAYMDIYFNSVAQNSSSVLAKESFLSALEKTHQWQKNLLSNERANISQKVYDFYSKKALFDKESNKLLWILDRLDVLNSQDIEAAKSTLNFNDNRNDFVDHPAFQNLLKASAIWKYLPNDIRKYRAYAKIYSIIESDFSGEAQCFLSAQLLVKVYEKSGESELGRSKINNIKDHCPSYLDQIMEMYGGDISGVENIAAPEIDMVNKSGGLVAIEDYKGQVVYISFWASWCKPCIEGFKKSKDIRKQLQDLGVVLINISIDKKEEAWRDAMIRHNPLGINTWAISLQDLAKDYDISAIPLYHIVNKQGKFAYLSNNGGRNIVEEFRVLVE